MRIEYLGLNASQKRTLKNSKMYQFYHCLVKRCQHSFLLERAGLSGSLPFEIVRHIQTFIEDTPTFISWITAFQIPLCDNLFCQVLAEQKWLEESGTLVNSLSKSIAETEFSKVSNDLRFYSFLFPTTYKITKRDNGFAVTSYKKHLVPFDYDTFFSTPSRVHTPYIDVHNFRAVQNDPQGRHFVYTPYRIIHIYEPHYHTHVLQIKKKFPKVLERKYKEIQMVFDFLKVDNLKIEPWTLCYHQTKSQWEPCQEWIDYLVMIYDFQQANSQILKNYKLRVS